MPSITVWGPADGSGRHAKSPFFGEPPKALPLGERAERTRPFLAAGAFLLQRGSLQASAWKSSCCPAASHRLDDMPMSRQGACGLLTISGSERAAAPSDGRLP